MNRIQRITEMEARLDASREAVDRMAAALDEYEAAQAAYKKLSDYYGSEQWIKDFEADEAGKLPADLKRGVLSEDAAYDLIIDNRELLTRMLKLVIAGIEKDTI